MKKISTPVPVPDYSLINCGCSAAMPPSFFYGVLLPSISSGNQVVAALDSVQHLIWGVRAILAELKYKDGFLNSPNAYAFYQNELVCLESYFKQLEEKSAQL